MKANKKHKIFIILLFSIMALPIPISLFSWIGTIISIANIGDIDWVNINECIHSIFAIIVMLLAGTYAISYIASLVATIRYHKIYWFSFLPVLHIALFIILWRSPIFS